MLTKHDLIDAREVRYRRMNLRVTAQTFRRMLKPAWTITNMTEMLSWQVRRSSSSRQRDAHDVVVETLIDLVYFLHLVQCIQLDICFGQCAQLRWIVAASRTGQSQDHTLARRKA
jgi:hypothetical protein